MILAARVNSGVACSVTVYEISNVENAGAHIANITSGVHVATQKVLIGVVPYLTSHVVTFCNTGTIHTVAVHSPLAVVQSFNLSSLSLASTLT